MVIEQKTKTLNDKNGGLKDINDTISIINDGNVNVFTIGSNYILGNYTSIINQNGQLIIGENFKTGIGVNINAYGGSIIIGENVRINDQTVLYGNGGLLIGDNTQIESHCIVITSSHRSDRTDIPISRQGLRKKGVKIGNDVLIGANVTILDGVEIGEGVIVGAGSVVNKSISPYSLAVGNPATVIKQRIHNDFFSFEILNMSMIDFLYTREKEKNKEIIDKVLTFTSSDVDFIAEEERAFPSDPEFIKSGYCNTMFKRYFFAGSFFCKDKIVLDSCSGLGWGTYILSHYSKTVTAFDMEHEAISFCKEAWECNNVSWLKGDALNISFLENKKFDVVTAFETIEHFTQTDGEEYVKQMSNALKNEGFLIGTSFFPKTKQKADKLCSTNKYHLHIFTENEMDAILQKYFKEYVIIDQWMFIARK